MAEAPLGSSLIWTSNAPSSLPSSLAFIEFQLSPRVSDALRVYTLLSPDLVAATTGRAFSIAKWKGLAYIELPIAFDGLTVVVNKKNTFVDKLTVAELKKIWQPGSKVKNWSDVRAGWPAKAIKLYGPGTDSGTFDYFTEAINGKSKESRSDYTASEDDNVLVNGVSGDESALGYFGLAYYEENKDKLRAVPIDGGKGPVSPSVETVKNGKYAPLSRPLFIYVSTKSMARPEVDAFVKFYLKNAANLTKEVGYIPLPAEPYTAVTAHYTKKKNGSVFMGKDTIGLTIQDVLASEK